jgi:hypothetical protein
VVAVRGYRWDHRWRTGVVLLAMMAALVSALGFVEPARADDASAAPADAAAAADAEPSPPADQPAADAAPTEPATPDPEPAPQPEQSPEPAPQEPSSSGNPPSEPAASMEPPSDAVTLEPETPPAAHSAPTAESPQAACDASSAAGEPADAAACAEQAEAAAATAPQVAAAPTATPAAQPPATAPVVIVVSLAPEQPAAVPAQTDAVTHTGAVADLAVEGNAVAQLVPSCEPAVELARVTVGIANLAEAGSDAGAMAPTGPASGLAPPLSEEALRYLPTVPIAVSTAAISQGARAAPRERDGHREVAAAEPKPPSAGGSPPGPFDDQGPGASGGSGGGAPGSSASSRYFAIATTPLRFEFPSAFAHTLVPSSVPEGALEPAPTTRPG